MKLNGTFTHREVAGEILVIPVGKTALTLNGMIILNPVSKVIWECLEMGAEREQMLAAVTDDGATGNDADKGILIVHHRHEILIRGPAHQLLHGGGNPNRHIVLAPGNFRDPPGFRHTQIHAA